jgi:hypothetical protein
MYLEAHVRIEQFHHRSFLLDLSKNTTIAYKWYPSFRTVIMVGLDNQPISLASTTGTVRSTSSTLKTAQRIGHGIRVRTVNEEIELDGFASTFVSVFVITMIMVISLTVYRDGDKSKSQGREQDLHDGPFLMF